MSFRAEVFVDSLDKWFGPDMRFERRTEARIYAMRLFEVFETASNLRIVECDDAANYEFGTRRLRRIKAAPAARGGAEVAPLKRKA